MYGYTPYLSVYLTEPTGCPDFFQLSGTEHTLYIGLYMLVSCMMCFVYQKAFHTLFFV